MDFGIVFRSQLVWYGLFDPKFGLLQWCSLVLLPYLRYFRARVCLSFGVAGRWTPHAMCCNVVASSYAVWNLLLINHLTVLSEHIPSCLDRNTLLMLYHCQLCPWLSIQITPFVALFLLALSHISVHAFFIPIFILKKIIYIYFILFFIHVTLFYVLYTNLSYLFFSSY